MFSRTNIGNAKLFGLEKAIGLEGMEYNTALCKYPYRIYGMGFTDNVTL